MNVARTRPVQAAKPLNQSNCSFYLELSLGRQNCPSSVTILWYTYIYQNCSYNPGTYHDCPVGYVPELFQFSYVRILGTFLVLNELFSVEILVKLDAGSKKEVVDELVDSCDMDTLLNVRLTIFGHAKKKLVATIAEPGNMDLEPAITEYVPHDQKSDAYSVINEWFLIARRSEMHVAMDVVDFLLCISGVYLWFPHKIVKRSKKARRIGSKSRRHRVRETGQSILKFTPASKQNAAPQSADNPTYTGHIV